MTTDFALTYVFKMSSFGTTLKNMRNAKEKIENIVSVQV